MININSKSYPYLAIAQHCCVDYAKVLEFSMQLSNLKTITGSFGPPPYTEWRTKVWELERAKNNLK